MSDKSQGRKHDDSAKRNKQQEVEERQPGLQSQEQTRGAAAGAYQRVSTTPPPAINPNDILALQRTAGNQAVAQLLKQAGNTAKPGGNKPPSVQPKLTVGPVGDKYEQEADRVAETVVRMPTSKSKGAVPDKGANSGWPGWQEIQRDELEEEEIAQTKPLVHLAAAGGNDDAGDADDGIQRDGGKGSFEPGSDFESKLSAVQGGGVPLAPSLRTPMEQAFGNDFSNVRVHNGAESDNLNQSIQARAFTSGQDIYFRSGEYNSNSAGGKELLAHELTHTIQQGGDSNKVQFKPKVGVIQRRLKGSKAAMDAMIQDKGKQWVKILKRLEAYEDLEEGQIEIVEQNTFYKNILTRSSGMRSKEMLTEYSQSNKVVAAMFMEMLRGLNDLIRAVTTWLGRRKHQLTEKFKKK